MEEEKVGCAPGTELRGLAGRRRRSEGQQEHGDDPEAGKKR